MAMRRMNEMWRRTALTLVLSVLALHGCQGQTDTVTPNAMQQTATPELVSSTAEININSTIVNSHQMTTDATANPTSADAKDTSLDPKRSQHATSQTDMTETTEQARTSLPAASADEEIKKHLSPEQTHQNPQTASTLPPTPKPMPTSYASSTCVDGTEVQGKELKDASNCKRVASASQIQSTQATQTTPATQITPTTQTANVFVPVLVAGLGLAAVLIGTYAWKNKSQRKAKDMKLAEASFMADEENQGNTLVSVAPLNTLESQEKTSQNGEFLEAVKTQNPPAATNGHSATKSDTEL